jgi:NADH-quinone oxidoreductase subunit L
LEGVGLCSYLLIGFWYENIEYGKAARKAFIMNRIGDLGLLIGIFLMFKYLGSVDYLTLISSSINNQTGIITAICIALFIGAIGKSAQIPLFTWLPDAMAGPTPVSALIHAATMVTAGIYLIARSNFLYNLSHEALQIILIIGLLTSFISGIIALRQNDIKKVLAYSTVSQLGLMFAALGVGAYTTAMFHVTTHAFFKALLFLGAGSVIHALHGEQDIRNMGGLKKFMPTTFFTFLIGTMAIIGFPLTSGFFSKDEILAKLWANDPIYWILGVACSIITAFYMLRMFFLTFYGNFRGTEKQKQHLHESPAVITIPLIILACLSAFGGLLNLPHFTGNFAQFASHFFESVIPIEHEHLMDFNTELMLMGIAIFIIISIILLTKNWYITKNAIPLTDNKLIGWEKVLNNKLYIDEIYNSIIVEPIEYIADFWNNVVEKKWIDGIVNGSGYLVQWASSGLRTLQNGNIEYYLLYMTFGMIVIILIGRFL